MTTDKDLKQKQQAARTHGVYAFRDRGEAALTEAGKSYLQELREKVTNRDGVLELLRENAVKSFMMAEILTSYVKEETDAGIPLEEIHSIRSLPAFYNTAQRALRDLLQNMPAEPRDNIEMDHIQRIIDNDNTTGQDRTAEVPSVTE